MQISILGRTLHTRGLTPEIDNWIQKAWGYAPSATGGQPFDIAVKAAAPTATLDSATRRLERPGLWIGNIPNGWGFETAGGSGDLVLTGREASIRILLRSLDPSSAVAFFEGVYLLVATALSASGLLPLHGAAAIHADPGLTLFLGNSGIGKSSTLLRLIRSGWAPIMEDSGWLDPSSGILWGWDSGIRVYPHVLQQFRWDIGPTDAPAADGKVLLSYEQLGCTGPRSGLLNRIIVLSRHESEQPGWNNLTDREWVRAGWEAIGNVLDSGARSRAADWISAQASAGSYRRFNLGPEMIPFQVLEPAGTRY